MFRFLRAKRAQRELALADANALIAQYGQAAYGYARERAHEARQGEIIDGNRSHGHWDRVRRIIGRKINRDGLDTATRYLDDPARSRRKHNEC